MAISLEKRIQLLNQPTTVATFRSIVEVIKAVEFPQVISPEDQKTQRRSKRLRLRMMDTLPVAKIEALGGALINEYTHLPHFYETFETLQQLKTQLNQIKEKQQREIFLHEIQMNLTGRLFNGIAELYIRNIYPRGVFIPSEYVSLLWEKAYSGKKSPIINLFKERGFKETSMPNMLVIHHEETENPTITAAIEVTAAKNLDPLVKKTYGWEQEKKGVDRRIPDGIIDSRSPIIFAVRADSRLSEQNRISLNEQQIQILDIPITGGLLAKFVSFVMEATEDEIYGASSKDIQKEMAYQARRLPDMLIGHIQHARERVVLGDTTTFGTILALIDHLPIDAITGEN